MISFGSNPTPAAGAPPSPSPSPPASRSHTKQRTESQCPSVKVVIVGESSVGKSAIAWRFCRGEFQMQLEATVGAAFMWRVAEIAPETMQRVESGQTRRAEGEGPSTTTTTTTTTNTSSGGTPRRLKFEIWDTAGQERYRSLVPVYYRNASAALIVYDITDRRTFERSVMWIRELQKNVHHEDPLQMILIGSKADLAVSSGAPSSTTNPSHPNGAERQVQYEEGAQVANEEGLAGFFETSAKENVNINEVFDWLGALLLHQADQKQQESATGGEGGPVRLSHDGTAASSGWGGSGMCGCS